MAAEVVDDEEEGGMAMSVFVVCCNSGGGGGAVVAVVVCPLEAEDGVGVEGTFIVNKAHTVDIYTHSLARSLVRSLSRFCISYNVVRRVVVDKDGGVVERKRRKERGVMCVKCYPTVYRAGKRKEKVLPALLKSEKYSLLFTISASRCPMLQDKLTFCTQTPRTHTHTQHNTTTTTHDTLHKLPLFLDSKRF